MNYSSPFETVGLTLRSDFLRWWETVKEII